MLSALYAEFCKLALYAECHYTECNYTECCYAECRGTSSQDVTLPALILWR
jgi:hypothetical protein